MTPPELSKYYDKLKKTENELLPCPFCGGKAELLTGWYSDYNYMIACETPFCATMISNEVGCESIAKRWNTREQAEDEK